MASIKELKKDIHYVTNQLIMECLVADIYLKGEHETRLTELAQQIFAKKQELIDKINEFKRKKNEVKSNEYFGSIREDFHKLIKEVLDEINNLL